MEKVLDTMNERVHTLKYESSIYCIGFIYSTLLIISSVYMYVSIYFLLNFAIIKWKEMSQIILKHIYRK